MLRVVLGLSLFMLPAAAQLPASGTWPDADWRAIRAEIGRIERELVSAPDKNTVSYEMARTWAAAKQWPEAIVWLRKIAASGIDPARDSTFAALKGTKEFEEVLARVREATPAISSSTLAFELSEGDLAPESVAYDPKSGLFYFGSMRKGKIVRCSATGTCSDFASGLGVVLGLKIHDGALWVLSNSEQQSALIHYDLESARAVRKYTVSGAGHKFNDLAIAPPGDIYLTDTTAGAVWHLASAAGELTRLPGRFKSANGIALSVDSRLLYVSVFPDGISVVDLAARAAAPIARPAGLCLANIDGLYFYRGTLIAIQNGFMSPRVVRLWLTPDLRGIERFEVLERRNPLFDGVTTGVVAGRDFFYMANIQDEKNDGFDPILILKIWP